MFEVQRRHRVV